MQGYRIRMLVLGVGCALASVNGLAQRLLATVPVGKKPYDEAINSLTNKIYVANLCGNSRSCSSTGTVAIIDGATNNTVSVNVGRYPAKVAVNSVTNRIYVANGCGNDPNCASAGTVSVIDGTSNTVVATVTVGASPFSLAVNSVTNKIYVANSCGNDFSCATHSGTVTVIDGATLGTTTVAVGANPSAVAVNSVTNQIYVTNQCGNDPACPYYPFSQGTVTVIDGATNNLVSVDVGFVPFGVGVNSVTNKTYVANECGDDPHCARITGTVTVIDGATRGTNTVGIEGQPLALALNPVTNKIYVQSDCILNPSCTPSGGTLTEIDGFTLSTANLSVASESHSLAVDSTRNQVYVANFCGNDSTCQTHDGTVTAIDGASFTRTTDVAVGNGPLALVVNPETNRIYAANFCGDDPTCHNPDNGTVSVITGIQALQLVSVAPCRLIDTRETGGPIQGGTSRDFPVPQEGGCNIPATTAAYSLNVSVVPHEHLGYLTVWPAGSPKPYVSTLNSPDGRIKANAAIVSAGAGGAVSVYATNTTDVILDINGYFALPAQNTLQFYPLPPCRVVDTRDNQNPPPPPGLGGPYLQGREVRDLPILSSPCLSGVLDPKAYSLNVAVVPHPSGTRLNYLTLWPSDQQQPYVSTLNNPTATVVANAAIVPAAANGNIKVFAYNGTDVIMDINGYFAAPGQNGQDGLSFYAVTPCRAYDSRNNNGQPFRGTRQINVAGSPCAPPASAGAFVFNAAVVPSGVMPYLTLWPDPEDKPFVATLNAYDAYITSNMAIVPNEDGTTDAYVDGLTHLILDISGYFAP